MGRPRSENPKNAAIFVRLTTATYDVLQEVADLEGIKLAALIRGYAERAAAVAVADPLVQDRLALKRAYREREGGMVTAITKRRSHNRT